MRLLSFLSVLLVSLMSLMGASSAQEFKVDPLQSKIYSTIEQVLPSVVAVSSGGSTFSGVIVSSEGHVLSAGHAINPGDSYRILMSDGRRLQAKGLGANGQHDCALLKIDNASGLPFAEMGDSSVLKTFQPCLSISHPGGYNRSRGPVIRFGHIVRPLTSRQGMVQSTALMEPGDSGGALFDLNGSVVAIHSRIGTSMDRNYEVPVNKFRKYWDDLNEQNSLAISRVPGLPKLGFQCENVEGSDNVIVLSVAADGVTRKAGLQVKDIISSVNGTAIKSTSQLRKALVKARENAAAQITLVIQRDKQRMELNVPYVKAAKATKQQPATPLEARFQKPIPELEKFSLQFSELESKLDDQCVAITSRSGKKALEIRGTLVADSNLVVSKSSRVGDEPTINVSGKSVPLKIVARDPSNDLILLRRPSKNQVGVRWNNKLNSKQSLGRFLITPDPNGNGLVSVWSSRAFPSRKRVSKGYLGVILSNDDNQGAVLQEINRGAAQDAGIQEGDVITKMNKTPIRGRSDLLKFLAKTDPNNLIQAKIRRGDQVLEKTITLGNPPVEGNHVAEKMDKSGRRDGFSKVISHDADLQPDECGGPLFDWQGNLIGLNIARNSRVRSYALTPSVVQNFINNNR